MKPHRIIWVHQQAVIPVGILVAIIHVIGPTALPVEEPAVANIAEARVEMNIPEMDVVEYVEERVDVQVVMVKEVTIIKLLKISIL